MQREAGPAEAKEQHVKHVPAVDAPIQQDCY
jgi:hypothetical protein